MAQNPEQKDRELASRAEAFLTLRVIEVSRKTDVIEVSPCVCYDDGVGCVTSPDCPQHSTHVTCKMPGQRRNVITAVDEMGIAFTFDVDDGTMEKVFTPAHQKYMKRKELGNR